MGAAESSETRQTIQLRHEQRAQQRAPRKQDRQAIGEPGKLTRSVFQSEPAEERILRSAPGRIAQVVGNGVDAKEQDARLEPCRAPYERSITGAEVDVDRLESAGQIEQSSTVNLALFPAFDEDHVVRITRPSAHCCGQRDGAAVAGV